MAFGDEAGIFYDVPDKEYHACKLPSNSAVKTYTQHPALYELKYLAKSDEQETMKQYFQQGKAYELLLLENHKADMLMTFKTKTYDSVDAMKTAAENPDKILLTESDLRAVQRWADCAKKVFHYPLDGKAQVSGVCDLEGLEMPVRVKFRLDLVSFEERTIYDYKLVAMGSASPGEFERMTWDLGYDTQAALYLLCMNQMFPGEPWQFWFRVQEKHYHGYDPRFCAEYRLDSLSIEKAESHIKMQLQRIAHGVFEGYGKGTISTERFKWGR